MFAVRMGTNVTVKIVIKVKLELIRFIMTKVFLMIFRMFLSIGNTEKHNIYLSLRLPNSTRKICLK